MITVLCILFPYLGMIYFIVPDIRRIEGVVWKCQGTETGKQYIRFQVQCLLTVSQDDFSLT